MTYKIIDITRKERYEKYLYKCLAPMPFRKYRRRYEYLQNAIPEGFHKKILIWNNEVVGQIEYAPADASGLPIVGPDIFVMNCIWVLRKAKGNNFGKALLRNTIRSIKGKNIKGLVTIALENHPSPWLEKNQIKKLGFKPVKSIKLKHKIKHRGHIFKVYLMWFPVEKDVEIPFWETKNLTEGVKFCLAHPLYRAESTKLKQIFEITNGKG